MKMSDSIVKIAPALLKAQKLMGSASKDAKNPFFKSKYADYGAVLEACKGPLNDNGISVIQPHITRDGKAFVETYLIHESGEWISGETEVVCAKQNDPQALGSAITYSRRYGLQSLVSLPAEDDDGNAGSGKTTTAATKPVLVNHKDGQEAPEVVAAKAASTVAAKSSSFKTATPAKTEAATTPAATKAATNLGW